MPSLREYTARFGLTPERAGRLPGDALVMHPGPMNRGRRDRPRGGRSAQRRHHRPGRQRRGRADGRAVLAARLGRAARRCRQPAEGGPDGDVVIRGGDRWSTTRVAGGPTCWSRTGAIVAVGAGPRRPATVARRRRLRRGARPRRPPHPPAPARPGGGRDRRDRELGPPPSVASPRWWRCPTPSRPSTRAAWSARCRSSGGAALCDVHVAGAITVGRAGERWRRWPRWPRSACASSPTTAAACRTPASCAGPWSTPRPRRHPGPALRGRGPGRGRRTCTRASGRAASASPASRPRPRS